MLWKKKEKKEKKSPFEIALEEYNKECTEPFGEVTNNGDNNMILSQNVYLSLNSQQTKRNTNVFVVSGTGTGKITHFITPNILQVNANYIIMDSFGDLLESNAPIFEKNGYKTQVFDLVEMNKSERYNPLDFVKTDEDIENIIKDFMKNPSSSFVKNDDAFFVKLESGLLFSIVYYLVRYRPAEERNFANVLNLLKKANPDNVNENGQTQLDIMFENVKANDPDSQAVKYYKAFYELTNSFKKMISSSLLMRLSAFDHKDFQDLTSQTTIDIKTMQEGKMALFIKTSILDSTYNFILSMLITQLATTIENSHQMPTNHIRFMLDEFTNIGYMGNIATIMATANRYNMSFSIILQNIPQLKKLYPYEWETILGNCDSFLYLDGKEYETLEYITRLFKRAETNAAKKEKSKKDDTIYPQNVEDFFTLDPSMCVLFVRGVNPFMDKKFICENHKNFI